MSDLQYNLQFKRLCNNLQLGDIIDEPKAISGGLLHRMYAIETIQGKYAIKALNPKIMLRPVAMENYINSERIANIASKLIPALPAKTFNGVSIHEIDNQFYLVFDWIDGKSLKSNEISITHCEKIGVILAEIHKIDFSYLRIVNDSSDNTQIIDWNYYLSKGQESNIEWFNQFNEVIDRLYYWNAEAVKSSGLLMSDMTISHRDLDPKNVMWDNNNPIIIDWESAGYTNPMAELVETAVYWSENEMGTIDKGRFLAFIGGYEKRYGDFNTNWKMVLINNFTGKLNWLEYNLKRSLWIKCTDEKEHQLGISQVTETINSIMRYEDMIPVLEKWLNNEI